MAREMALDAFWQKALAAALASARESRASTFGLHACAESVLTFPCAFRWLISAFHKAGPCDSRELKAVTLGWSRGMSMQAQGMSIFWIRRLPARAISAINQCKP